MPLYVADYDAATNWCDLETDGLYMRVLRLLWSTPSQSIPNDPKWLKRKLRITDAQYELFEIILDEYLDIDDGRIFQKRLSEEFVKAETIHNSKVEAGKKGGKAKSLKTNEKVSSTAKAQLKHSPSVALASTSTITSTDTIIDNIPPIPPKRGKCKSQWPKDFIPSKVAAEKYWSDRDRQDLNYDDEAQQFKDWCIANGKKYLDWEAAWRTRYTNAVKYNKKPFDNKSLFDKPSVVSAEELEEMLK